LRTADAGRRKSSAGLYGLGQGLGPLGADCSWDRIRAFHAVESLQAPGEGEKQQQRREKNTQVQMNIAHFFDVHAYFLL